MGTFFGRHTLKRSLHPTVRIRWSASDRVESQSLSQRVPYGHKIPALEEEPHADSISKYRTSKGGTSATAWKTSPIGKARELGARIDSQPAHVNEESNLAFRLCRAIDVSFVLWPALSYMRGLPQ